jgi:hypothetical protein
MKAAATTVGLVVLLAGCSAPRNNGHQTADSGPAVVARDAGPDVRPRRDAAEADSTLPEAGPALDADAGAETDYTYPGRWMTMPDLPKGCDIRISLMPDISIPALD